MSTSLDPVVIQIVHFTCSEAETLAAALQAQGFSAVVVKEWSAALEWVRENRPCVVFAAMNGDKPAVMQFLGRVNDSPDPPPVIVVAAQARVEDAAELMKRGAHDFWVTPIAIERMVKTAQLLVAESRTEAAPRAPIEVEIITRDSALERLKAIARQVAPSAAAVFIQGESGTGKELFARYLHFHSPRRSKPFVAVNCAALPENLLESELFGHEKGAFTGASRAKKGKFELAHGGTLLLDEVTEIPLHLQAKLLRVLQEKEVDRIGGLRPIAVDVRVLATSNVNVLNAVRDGRFRSDLYYRLNVLPLKLPPLRDRAVDIPLLCEHFIAKFTAEAGTHQGRPPKLSTAALETLRTYSWPGNVRELENVIHRAVLLSSDGRIDRDQLLLDEIPPLANGEEDAVELTTVEEMERRMIRTALHRYDGNRTRAAEILGISVRTLRNKLQNYRETGLLESGA